MNTNDRKALIEELLKAQPPWKRKAAPLARPTLTLVASRDRDGEQVASVALEPDDVAIVREALAGRGVRIGADDVSFDHVTNARVMMRWSSPKSPTSPPLVREQVRDDFGHAVFAYDPYAKERMPGYDPAEE
jgi:hypothetical protein